MPVWGGNYYQTWCIMPTMSDLYRAEGERGYLIYRLTNKIVEVRSNIYPICVHIWHIGVNNKMVNRLYSLFIDFVRGSKAMNNSWNVSLAMCPCEKIQMFEAKVFLLAYCLSARDSGRDSGNSPGRINIVNLGSWWNKCLPALHATFWNMFWSYFTLG